MKFTPLSLRGAFVIDLEPFHDERGFFATAWCSSEFRRHGLNPSAAQTNISFNRSRGTLRGMHYQVAPHEQPKLVRCTAGGVFDVIIDLRPDSPTFKQWLGVDLTAANYRSLFVPAGFAHGFQTLAENTEVFYHMSAPHEATAAHGVRWNDPAFGVRWPIDPPVMMAARDATYPDFQR